MTTKMQIGQAAADRGACTIASGASLSSAITLARNGGNPRGAVVEVPAVWTAADIGFEVSNDNVTYMPLRYKDGTMMRISGVITNAANPYAAPAELFVGLTYNYLKLKSLTAGLETAVNQGAERALVMQFAY